MIRGSRGAQLAAVAHARAVKARQIARAREQHAFMRAAHERIKELSKTPTEGDQFLLLAPGRISMENLRCGRASIEDLHNIVALLNTALVLADDVGEDAARGAIQDGIVAMAEVKDRKTVRFAMSAAQRARISPAVDLADELFCCCTLLEIVAAHTKLMSWLQKEGSLELVEVRE